MSVLLWIVYAVCMFGLYWIYDGYGRFLRLFVWLKSGVSNIDQPEFVPSVCVLLTVHNEQSVVEGRVHNILECDYPADRLSIVVASDGSTDNTNRIVSQIDDARVRLIKTDGLGKTATQNAALKQLQADIVLFTDADTKFDRNFITEITRPFADSRVGAVDGRLLYTEQSLDANVRSQGYYWNYELGIRECESKLGLLAVVTGASFAVRRNLIQPMDPSIGEDCIVPLDVVLQNHTVVHQPTAKAYDTFEEGDAITFKRRVRMTLRNWQGTWSRSTLLNPAKHPGYAFALWSHKVLRWLSPFFFACAALITVALLWMQPNLITIGLTLPIVGIFGAAIAHQLPLLRRIPGTGSAYSWLLVNTAFLVGISKAIAGNQVRSYRTERPPEQIQAA